MALYRATVKHNVNCNGVKLEKGMSVEVVTKSISNPLTTNGGVEVIAAFQRIYGVDIKKAGATSSAWIDIEHIR